MKKLYRTRDPEAAPLASLPRAALHLGGLSSFAIARQYFEPLSKSGEFFVEHAATGLDILVFAIGLLVLPPAVLVLLEAFAGFLSGRLRDLVHLGAVGAFIALILWQVLEKEAPALPSAGVVLATLAGGAAALAYWRLAAVRSYATVLSVGPILVLALFLVFSPVRVLVFGGDGGDPVQDVTAEAPVVMIVFDELPVASLMDERRRIDPVRYPNFARVADDGTWYRNAATVADFTQIAVPSILSGQVATRDQLPIASEHPDNLFRLLGGSYRLDVIEWKTDLCGEPSCPSRVGRSLGQRLRSMLHDARDIPVFPGAVRYRLAGLLERDEGAIRDSAGANVDGPSVRRDAFLPQDERLEVFVESLRPSDGRTLNFLHLLSPHWRWDRLPTGQRYEILRAPWEGSYPKQWPKDPRGPAVAYQRHLMQLAHLDGMLGEVIGKLERIGLYDRALIVLTADHGVSFKPGGVVRVVNEANVADVAPVPLIVKSPGQRTGRIDDGYLDTTDILPTIAAELDIRIPWNTDGSPADRIGRSRETLTVQRTFGGEVKVDRTQLEARRDAELRRKLALFGSGRGEPGRLFALGGHRGLLGRSVKRLPVGPRSGLVATVDGAERYRSVDLDAPVLPAEVSGLIKGRGAERRRVAIAVNGTIAATTLTLPSEEGEYYTAVCPAGAFRSGANRIEVEDVRIVVELRWRSRWVGGQTVTGSAIS